MNLCPRDRSVEIGGFIITETIRRAGLIIPQHCHEHDNIGFVLNGSFQESIGKRLFEFGTRSVVFRPAGEPHRNHYGARPARCLIVEVRHPRFESIAGDLNLLGRASHINSAAISNLGIRILSEFRQMDDASPLAIEGLILEVLAQGIREDLSQNYSRKKPRWLRQARDFIHADFCKTITLSQVSNAVGIHPAHVAKTFRQHFGCTLGEYVRTLRLNHAEHLLKSSSRSLSDIAISSGFYDQSHFSNAFKFRKGFTPTEFRKLTRTRKSGSK